MECKNKQILHFCFQKLEKIKKNDKNDDISNIMDTWLTYQNFRKG